MPETYVDITLAADWDKYKAGETVAVTTKIGMNLVTQGIARCPRLNPVVPEEPKVKPQPETAKKKAKKKSRR